MTSRNNYFSLVAALALTGAAGATDLAQVYQMAKERDPILRGRGALHGGTRSEAAGVVRLLAAD
jgi:hypothetical protein